MKTPSLTEIYNILIDNVNNNTVYIPKDISDYINSYSKFQTWISQFEFAKYKIYNLEHLAEEYNISISMKQKYIYVITNTKNGWPNSTYLFNYIKTEKQLKSIKLQAEKDNEVIHIFDIENGKEI